MENMLTIGDLATRSGVAEQTLRRWLKQFKPFFPCREFGRHRKYPVSVLETIHYIHEQFRAGEGAAAILASLQESDPLPQALTVASPGASSAPMSPSQPTLDLAERLTAALEALAHRDQEMAELRQSVDRLTRQVTQLLESSGRHPQPLLKSDFRRLPLNRDPRETSVGISPTPPVAAVSIAPVIASPPAAASTSLSPSPDQAAANLSAAAILPPPAIDDSAIITTAVMEIPPRPQTTPSPSSPIEAASPNGSETQRIQRASEISKKTLECLIQTNADVDFLTGQASPWWRRLFHK